MNPKQKKEFKKIIGELTIELKKKLNLKTVPKLILAENQKNADDILGKTGYYDQQTKTIKLYITNRHPKDILRSFCHEYIHHFQNEMGMLKSLNTSPNDPNYAQNNPILRKAEEDAYRIGNMIFRDWTDGVANEKKNN